MRNQTDKLWTTGDVAEYCQVKPSVVEYWLRNSDLPHLKLGKFIRFDPEDVREWVDAARRGGGTGFSGLKRDSGSPLRRLTP